MGVTVLYPIVEALTKNSNIPNITKEQIVLMTIFSITQILHVSNEDVKKIKVELKKDDLFDVAKRIKKSLLSVFKIFKFVSKSFGKITDVFTDMLAYVALGTPFAIAITEIISKDGLNLETLPQKVLVTGAGAALYTLKSMIETLVIMIKNKMNNKKQL